MKSQGVFAFFVLGLLFLAQSIFIAFRLSSLEEVNNLAGSLFGCSGCWLWALYLYSAQHRRSLKVALIFLVVAFVSVSFALSTTRFLHDKRLETEAKQWAVLAQESAKPTWTEDDAVHWFKDHGILPYQGERSGTDGHYYLVDGYRQIEGRGMVTRPASVQLSFLFDLTHKFQRVDYGVQPFEPPHLRRR
jgi:hypothetical protein